MTASTSGTGPRSNKRMDAIEERRRQFDRWIDEQMRNPKPGRHLILDTAGQASRTLTTREG